MSSARTGTTDKTLRLPRMSVVLVLFLYFITVLIYEPIWYLRRKRAINNLSSSKKIGAMPWALLVVSVIDAPLLVLGALEGTPGVATPLGIVSWFMSILLAFQVKQAIEEDAARRTNVPVRTSEVPTFLFRILYLQYKINRLNAAALSAVASQPLQSAGVPRDRS